MKNFLGFNMQDPKMLIKEVSDLAELIRITLVCLKEGIYGTETIQRYKEDLTGAIEDLKIAQKALDYNVWHNLVNAFKSSSDLLKEWEILFDSARLIWIAEKLTKGNFLSNPQSVPTSIGMLEALMPAVNSASVALTLSDLYSTMVAERIQYHFSVTQNLIETMARTNGFKDTNHLIQETLGQVQNVIDEEKKKT